MASIEFVPGRGYVMKVAGSGLSATPSFDSPTYYVDQYGRPIDPKDAGKEREVVIGSKEYDEMRQPYFDARNERLSRVGYDPNKDYRSMWSDLSGMGGLEGANTRWYHALRDRAKARAQGQNDGLGHYEMRAFGADPALQDKIYQRNNIIESMLSSGVSHNQIGQILAGQLDPANLGSLTPNSNWGKAYYTDRKPNPPYVSDVFPPQVTPPNPETNTSQGGGMLSSREKLMALLGF